MISVSVIYKFNLINSLIIFNNFDLELCSKMLITSALQLYNFTWVCYTSSPKQGLHAEKSKFSTVI